MKYNSNIIIACDFSNRYDLFNFLKKMGNQKLFLKLGMEIIYAEGFGIISELKKLKHNIFLDLKINDISNTTSKAIMSLAKYKPDFLTIHAFNSLENLKLANKTANRFNIKLLGVTLLTSLNDKDLHELNINVPLPLYVETLIKRIKKSLIYGVVSSASEAKIVKKNNLISVVPGVRFENNNNNDQKRISTPASAFKEGADFIVIGRAITNTSNPLEIYEKLKKEFNNER